MLVLTGDTEHTPQGRCRVMAAGLILTTDYGFGVGVGGGVMA
jgi:hypothetical protein